MSIKDLFNQQKKNDSVTLEKTVTDIFEEAESTGNIKEKLELNEKFVPLVDFSNPASFVRFGSAENYYSASITNIVNEYPYDGSQKEKNSFLKSSTYLDLYLLENKYPRTNGYAIISSNGWGTQASTTDGYGLPNSLEYIELYGGPHTASGGMTGKPLATTFESSNLYQADVYATAGVQASGRVGTRDSNLKLDPPQGYSVEFWMKKDNWITSLTRKEVVFDLWNGQPSSSAGYGRFTLFLTGTAANEGAWKFNVYSGTVGVSNVGVQSAAPLITQTTATVGDGNWHHYAFTFKSGSAGVTVKSYRDGALADTIIGALNLQEVTGALQARIGALITSPSGSTAAAGAGKLSSSLDEFRFWKTQRTDKQIYENYRYQVGGGTNTDISNTELGVYYKFNEGITTVDSIDSVVLDYSGRVTNGTWVGYPGSGARNTNSAMVLASATISEFKDPIVRAAHPDIVALRDSLIASGSEYDTFNNSSFFYSLPNWIVDEDRTGIGGNNLFNLTQIMASYMDELYASIRSLSEIKNKQYTSSSYEKPLPFNRSILESQGFVSPLIFKDAELAEKIFNHDERNQFESQINDTKNQIYNNIYNNLVYIYKSKGTQKGFRNLFRCFGVGEELINVNIYGNNLRYKYDDRYTFPSIGKKFADFNDPDHFNSNIYHKTGSTLTYVSGNLVNYDLREIGFTSEAEVVFPKKQSISSPSYFYTSFVSSSIFGFHLPNTSSATDYTFQSDDIAVQLHSIRTKEESPDVYFSLSASFGTGSGAVLTSSVFPETYDNKKWNFAISVKPDKFGLADGVTGTTGGTYTLQFHGIHKELDITVDSFTLTQSLTFEQGRNLTSSPKRYYAGAHKTNFTGSTATKTDLKIGSVRHWLYPLAADSIAAHAQNPSNHGTQNPSRNAFLNQTELTGTYVPEIETLALHWDFESVTSSDASGQFAVNDISSGSTSNLDRFGDISKSTEYVYEAIADSFPASSTKVTDKVFINFAELGIPDDISSYDLVQILDKDDEVFTRETLPVNYYFAFEKSPYRSISKDAVNMFASIKEFSNLYHQPVQRYRHEHKELRQLRELYFEKIGNTPDIEKYLSYYRWIDSSLSEMIRQLVPITADTSENINTVIESHALERNHIRYNYPLLKFVDNEIEGKVYGITEMLYPWHRGYSPLTNNENDNCHWWNARTERDNTVITSGDTTIDSQRDTFRRIIQTHSSASAPNLAQSDGTKYVGSDFAKRKFVKLYNLCISMDTRMGDLLNKAIQGGINVPPGFYSKLWKSIVNEVAGASLVISGFNTEEDCNDNIRDLCASRGQPTALQKIRKRFKVSFGTQTLSSFSVLPFTFVSASAGVPTTGYQAQMISDFGSTTKFDINGIHQDVYDTTLEIPMQGPFTEKYVGGSAYRHVDINHYSSTKAGTNSLDGVTDRTEGFQIDLTTDTITITNQPISRPRSTFARGTHAKRPVNITNIRHTASSAGTKLGNYNAPLDIVSSNGRMINDPFFVLTPFSASLVTSSYVVGMSDYTKLARTKKENIIVNRFSAPGDPATMGDNFGGPGLDAQHAEVSPYNALPWRNLSVRQPLITMLKTHQQGFGLKSGSFPTAETNGIASFHNAPGNRRVVIELSGTTYITASTFDNYFIQHQIPRSDLQYSWITGSATSYGGFSLSAADNVPFGFIPSDGKITSSAGFIDGVDFVLTAALSGTTQGTPYYPYNLNVLTPFDTSSNLIGFALGTDLTNYLNTDLNSGLSTTDAAATFNSIMATRASAFKLSSWSQIRNQNSKAMQTLKKNNLVSHTPEYGDESIIIDRNGRQVKRLRNEKTYTFTEPVIDTSNKPISIAISKKAGNQNINLLINISQNNDLLHFANEQLNNILEITNYNKERLVQIKRLVESEDITLKYIKFSNTAYPSRVNIGLEKIRARNNFENNFWRTSRTNRTSKGTLLKKAPYNINTTLSQSSWALDAEEDFTTTAILTGSSGSVAAGSKAGALQNCYVQVHGGQKDETRLAPLYSRKHTLGAKYSFVSLFGISIPSTGALGNIGSMASDYFPLGQGQLFGGNALWEASSQAGYLDDNGTFVSHSRPPFYDSYGDFNENTHIHNESYSIVPEFRISEHIDYYVNTRQGNFLSANTASFSIFGANSLTASAEIPENSAGTNFFGVFTTSDLFANLGRNLTELKDFVEPSQIKLKIRAIKKFVPYDGFFPAERTAELATQFSKSYSSHMSFQGTDTTSFVTDASNKMRPIYSTLFAPGILYNTIKSGIAVDYPAYIGAKEIIQIQNADITGSAGSQGIDPTTTSSTGYYLLGTGSNGINGFDYRVPFEAIIEPQNYIKNMAFSDMEPHPSASFSLTSSWDGSGDDLYTMMSNNFLAETVNFFLEQGEMTSLISGPQTEFKKFIPGKTYGMRVRLRRSMRTPRVFSTSYPTPQHNIFQTLGLIGDEPLTENFTMYSRPSAFGPPVAARRYVDTGSFPDAIEPDSLFGFNFGFTPPYYDGEAWTDILFTADSKTHTLDDIFGSGSVVNWRVDSSSNWPVGTLHDEVPYGQYVNNFAMQLTSSVNVFGKASIRSVEFDASGNPTIIKDDKQTNNQVWVIQPKFETPTLNFNDQGTHAITGSLITLPTNASESVPRGMWHQFGIVPTDPNKGIFLEVSNIEKEWLDNRAPLDSSTAATYDSGNVDSLLDIVNFKKKSTRIGKLSTSKTVYEAIVAIPFIERASKRKFFALDKELIASTAKKVTSPNYEFSTDEITPGDSIIDLVRKMDKYVIPPRFDFVNNSDSVDPISMYIFEFSHTFNQDDLAHIWQNLSPKLGTTPEFGETSLSHELAGNEILSYISETGDNKNSDLKWMVFKVKQRAQTSYFDKVLADNINTDPRFRKFDLKVGKRENDSQIPFYSYNWPYDFFTMIEFGKMDFDVVTKPKNEK
jgi:hypothetical protein